MKYTLWIASMIIDLALAASWVWVYQDSQGVFQFVWIGVGLILLYNNRLESFWPPTVKAYFENYDRFWGK